jgi:sterol desaturase/sphingolipid hydroxylase (fatty acid hydroxylase superfamily)
VTAAWYLPVFAFVALALLERVAPRRLPAGSRADHLLNLAGLVVQGVAVPAAGYLLVISVMAPRWPEYAAILPLGWWGAFMLNFVVVDLLYYVEHRLFHRFGALWALH